MNIIRNQLNKYMLKKEKFSTPLFIGLSLLALFLLFITRLSFVEMFIADPSVVKNIPADKIYLNEDYEDSKDPFLTKKPDLKDMLAGPIISGNDPVFGNEKAPVALVVFSDFQCEVCHGQEEVFGKIIEKYGDKVKLVWKDYPDKESGSVSFQASLAGRCANEQGGFWDYHNLLFDNKDKLNQDLFVELARKMKLDGDEFENCLKNEKYKQQIVDNLSEANALEINGVPFIYINDQEVMGEINFDDLSELIEGELKK